MNTLLIILSIIMIFVAAGIILLVLFQDTNDRGMGSMAGGSNDSFYSNNRGRTKDVLMRKLTIILAITFGILTVVIGLLLG